MASPAQIKQAEKKFKERFKFAFFTAYGIMEPKAPNYKISDAYEKVMSDPEINKDFSTCVADVHRKSLAVVFEKESDSLISWFCEIYCVEIVNMMSWGAFQVGSISSSASQLSLIFIFLSF